MYSDSKEDGSPAITFSRSVKPAARRLARVLQEEDSPISAQQVFKTPQQYPEQQISLQLHAGLSHCAGT
jgi:hypothetical protein